MHKALDKFFRFLRVRKVAPYIKKGDRVLDVGCGEDNKLLSDLSHLVGHGVGIDQDIGNKKEGNLEARSLQMEKKLPFPDKSFDVVTMLAVLEHIEHHIDMLSECYRVLVPGGKILITVPTHANKPVGEFLAYRLGIIDRKHYDDHKRYYNKKELTRDLEKVGFVEIGLHYWEFGLNLFARGLKKGI